MENKTTLREQQRALLLNLQGAVNDEESLAWVEQELAALDREVAEEAQAPMRIDSAASAGRFLAQLHIEVIGTAGGWILHWLRPEWDDYELTCDSEAELIEFACRARDTGALHLGRAVRRGPRLVSSREGTALWHSHSLTAEATLHEPVSAGRAPSAVGEQAREVRT